MRKLSFLLTLLFAIALQAQALGQSDNKGAGDVYMGLRAQSESRMGIDLGFSFGRAGASTWGVAIGYTTKTPDNSIDSYYTAKPSGVYERTREVRGYQVGAFTDLGRVVLTIGGESLVTTTQTTTVSGGTSYTAPEVSKSKAGAYGQIGFKVASHVSIYIHAGSASGVGAGVAFHF